MQYAKKKVNILFLLTLLYDKFKISKIINISRKII